MLNVDELLAARLVYQVAGMARAEVRRDLVYKSVDGADLLMDVYRSSENDESLPAVIFISGDAPEEIIKNSKDWGAYTGWGSLAAASGFAGVTFNHRSAERFSRPGRADAAGDEAIDFVRGQGGYLGIDPDRLAIWVCSAGPPFGLRSILRDTPEYVRCIAVYYGGMGFSENASEELRTTFSPLHWLETHPERVPPMLIARAGKDHPGLNETIDRFVTAATSANVQLDFMNHPDGQHGFDTLDDVPRSRQIMRRTIEFFKEHTS